MKICIIGPSCAGKTTLAADLKKIVKCETLDLDKVFVDTSKPRKIGEIFYKTKEEGEKLVDDFIKSNERWVIEGVFPVREVFKESELIIFIKPFFLTPIFRQWYRFFTDKYQRKTFGFKTNLTFLTPDILKQYFSKRGFDDLDDPREFGVRKYELILKKFGKKVIRVKSVDYGLESSFIDKIITMVK